MLNSEQFSQKKLRAASERNRGHGKNPVLDIDEFSRRQMQVSSINKYPHKNLDRAVQINKSREVFFETPKKAIKMINQFLSEMGIDMRDEFWQGRKDGFLFEATNKLVFGKYDTLEKNCGATIYRNDTGKYSGNTENGLTSLTFDHPLVIKTKESKYDTIYLPMLMHEYYHMIAYGEDGNRKHFIGKDDPLKTFLIEGSVELLKQLTLGYFEEFDNIKTYPNEVAFMSSLLDSVAIKLGNYKLATKLMVDWLSRGGIERPFVKICQKIKNENLPNGFDLYSVDEPNLRLVRGFEDQNKEKPYPVKDIIHNYRKDIGRIKF